MVSSKQDWAKWCNSRPTHWRTEGRVFLQWRHYFNALVIIEVFLIAIRYLPIFVVIRYLPTALKLLQGKSSIIYADKDLFSSVSVENIVLCQLRFCSPFFSANNAEFPFALSQLVILGPVSHRHMSAVVYVCSLMTQARGRLFASWLKISAHHSLK